MSEEVKYPECEKLAGLDKERSAIIQFIEWLNEQAAYIDCEDSPELMHKNPEQLAHKFLGIDDKKLEEERSAMLEALRS